jgi:hypothetical protein
MEQPHHLPCLFWSAFRSLYILYSRLAIFFSQSRKPLATNLNANNPLITDQSRFTIRLENNRARHERNQRCAVAVSMGGINAAHVSKMTLPK